ncbi:MAG: hypothetical protein U1E95_07710 [Rubrivivax sp.]
MCAVLRVDDAVEQPGRVARRFLRRRVASIQQRAAPALVGQCGGRRAAGQAGANDQRVAIGSGIDARHAPPRHEARRVGGAQRRGVIDREAGCGQRQAQLLQRQAFILAAPQPRTLRSQPGEALGDAARRVRCIGQPVRIIDAEFVDLRAQFGQHVEQRADGQQQMHLSAVEGQAMHIARWWRPLRRQRLGEWLQLAAGVGSPQRVGVHGRRGDGDVVEPRRPHDGLAPVLPSLEEVVAEAEARLQTGAARRGRRWPQAGAWHTASMLLPSGSMTKAP